MNENERLKRLYADVFSGPMGQEVLAHIMHVAIVDIPGFSPEHGASALAYQRGARDAAMKIASMAGVTKADMARALTGIVPKPEPVEPHPKEPEDDRKD